MTDPQPLTDDQMDALIRDADRLIGASPGDVRRLLATVEQARRERDAARAVIRRMDACWVAHIRRDITEWVKSTPYAYSQGDVHEERYDTAVEP